MFVEVTARLVGDDGVESLGMHVQRAVILGGDMHANLIDGSTQLLADIDVVKGAIVDQAAKLSRQLTPPPCTGHDRRKHKAQPMIWSDAEGMWVCLECGRTEPMA